MKFDKVKKILPAIALFLVIAGMLLRYFSTKVSDAQFTEATNVLNTFAIAEESYYKTYTEYSSDRERLGFSYSSKNVKIYLSPQEVPQEYIKQIHENSVPYASKKSFKLLGIFKDEKGKRIYMWTIDNRKVVDYIGYLSY